MICTNCGNEVQENKYCNKCGTLATPPAQQQAAPTPPPPPSYSPPPPAQSYTAPSYQAPPPVMPQSNVFGVPSVKDYVIMQLIMLIPVAGIIMLIIWAVGGGDVPLWKSNFARSYWIMFAIGIALGIVLSIIIVAIAASIGAALADIPSYYW